ncbi:hypothetical protein GGE50_007266 [Rhizobium leguminosarum]|nr:integrase catalytic region [Rhizobium etli CNPAF512]MBB4333295.1 hypothetical protein [Rhizobium leguminosarum]MBB4357450.1 hypothetical protein [Rhizobium leguminosarum]MBB4511210.1 hypothetical protein [Rhizobium leguminosarum]MBB4553451.1 hypothetical protein [Rhizobium leguminosarum]
MATRAELVAAISCRYVLGGRAEKARMLDEFVALTGFHRKHAMRLLRGERKPAKGGPRPGRRVYGDDVRAALVVVWEASDRICGKRLHPLLPTLIEAMERHGHGDMNSETRRRLLTMSPATIDRVLKEIKASATGPRRRKGSTAIRRSVPVRTFSDWDDPALGFVEADLVSHSGPYPRGAFSQTLVLTDIATGWTECAPLLVREQTVLITALAELRKLLPFPLLGFDTDNDSVFMNESVHEYCLRDNIELTRCRPYRKNDQAFVEQKNGAIVRKIVGYRRFEGLRATRELAKLYSSMRLFVNFFQPSVKLEEKHRDGAKVIKRYHRPATLFQRLFDDPRTPEDTCLWLKAMYLTLEDFLSGLRIAWRGGEVKPTARSKPAAKRERRRPDPLLAVTAELEEWFEAEPWRTSRELLERLQVKCPGVYPDGLIRTVQRRMKIWRSTQANALVFGPFADAARQTESIEVGQ